MPSRRAASKSPARAKAGSRARSTSTGRQTGRAQGDAQRKATLKTGHGAAVAKAKKAAPKAVVAVQVADKKKVGYNAPVGGGQLIHGVAGGAWAYMAYTLWSNHADALTKATGFMATADVWTYAVVAPLYFAVSFLAIKLNDKDMEGWRCSIFNSLLFPVSAGMFARSFLNSEMMATTGAIEKITELGAPGWVNAEQPTTLDVSGDGKGYDLISARVNILFFSLMVEIFLVDFGKTTAIDAAIGGVKGFLAFFVFMFLLASKQSEATSLVTFGQSYSFGEAEKENVLSYLGLTALGLAIRILYEQFVMDPLTKGTGDAEVVQAKKAISGTGADEKALAAKKYDGIVIGSTANAAKGIKAKVGKK
jgi:F0F1-type ATP synthase assembly protein I